MGFLDDYGVSGETVTAPTRKLAKEGRYYFEIGDAVLRKGTRNAPKDVFVLFTYQLTDADDEPAGSVDEKFWVRRNGVYDDTCKQSMGYLDRRLKDAGFELGVDDPEYTNDNVIGLRGKLRVEHSTGRDNRIFANPRDVEFILSDDDDEPVSDEPSDYDDNDPRQDKAAANKAAKEPAAPARAARTSRAAKPSPAADNPWGDDE